MKRLSMLLVVVILGFALAGCPAVNSAGRDPYLMAHTIINQASLAIPVAEGIFNQWVYVQKDKDADKVKKAQLTFAKIKTIVSNALKLAHDGVDIAEQAKKDPEIEKLLEKADVAWGDLRQFLDELLDDGNHGIIVEDPEVEPGEPPSGEEMKVSVRMLVMTSKKNPIDSLPLTLIPE